jgi:hypothetical protein
LLRPGVSNRVRVLLLKWRWLLLIALGLVVLAIKLSDSSGRHPPLVSTLTRPFSGPVLLRDRIGRWIPNGSGWNWVRSVVFGHRNPINLNTELFTSLTTYQQMPTTHLGRPVFTNSAGIEIWFPTTSQIKVFKDALTKHPAANNLMNSRVSTADGITAALFCGQSVVLHGSTNQVGLETTYCTRTYQERTDLWMSAFFSEMVTNVPNGNAAPGQEVLVVTNLDVALRLEVPRGNGLILLTPRSNNRQPGCAGIVLDSF